MIVFNVPKMSATKSSEASNSLARMRWEGLALVSLNRPGLKVFTLYSVRGVEEEENLGELFKNSVRWEKNSLPKLERKLARCEAQQRLT